MYVFLGMRGMVLSEMELMVPATGWFDALGY